MLKALAAEDRLYSIASAFEMVTGQRPSPPTVWRWKKRGSKGVPLPFVQVGGQSRISPRAARQWLEDTTAAAKGHPPQPKPSKVKASQAATRLAEVLKG